MKIKWIIFTGIVTLFGLDVFDKTEAQIMAELNVMIDHGQKEAELELKEQL